MNSNSARYSLFINSLLSNKEILIKDSKDIQITECSVFRNSKTLIPVDLVSAQVKQGSRPNIQWILFGIVNVVAVTLFVTLALTQNIIFPYVLAGTFALLGVLSVFSAYKYKYSTYTFQYDESDINLFTLSSNDLNKDQITEFIKVLTTNIQSNKYLKDDEVDETVHETNKFDTQIETYSEHLSFLYNEGIVDDFLLDKLQKKIRNKVYGSVEDTINIQQDSNIIPFRSTKNGTGI